MLKRIHLAVLVLVVLSPLFACTSGKLDLKIKARMNGQPVAQARVMVDNTDVGLTDSEGAFSAVLEKKYDAEVVVTVTARDVPGYHIKPWKTSFIMKPPASGDAQPHALTADLEAMQYVTFTVTAGEKPVKDAAVRVDAKDAGTTDANGVFVYEFKDQPKSGLDLSVTRPGFAPWRRTGAVEPGLKIAVALIKRLTVHVTAQKEEFGDSTGIPGVSVSINEKLVGKTDGSGIFTWIYDGDLGKNKLPFELSIPGYLPETWKTTIAPEGAVTIKRYFQSLSPLPVRTGVYRFVGNTPNIDLSEVTNQAEAAVASQLFKNSSFREVKTDALKKEMKRAKLTIEKMTTKGWRESPLKKVVDLVIIGSVAKDEQGLLIEAKFYTSGGILIMSQIGRARSAADIATTAKDIVNAVIARFPFEGTVISGNEERYRVNLGKSGYQITKGTDFIVLTPRLDESGKIASLRETGRLRVKKLDDTGSWAEVEELKKGEQVMIGDRVIRRVYHDGEEEGVNNYFVLTVKGGVPPDVAPLASVNIYKNNQWFGATGPDGKAEVPVPLNKSFTLVLYRHGYQQMTEKMTVEQNKEAREFTLMVNNTVLKVDSEPRGADVFLDNEKIGKTPLLDGKQVPLGFHTLKVSLGDDYRDWEEVVEFSKKEESLAGDRKIFLTKDFLKIGERAEQKGDIDAAIQAYRSTLKGNMDYAESRHRLAGLYLDEKGDFDGAIREFETVLSAPENQQLIYKQFAVAFMNLGHAYYEKGSTLVQTNKEGAAKNFSKAIQNLQIAKQNTRFYPNMKYDEAVHDTYYYTALAYHKLYLLTRKATVLNNANLAWREYFDFFPRKLEGQRAFDDARDSAKKYWDQIKNL